MASPNSAFAEAAVMTLEGYSGDIADNVSKSNWLLRQLKKKGNMKPATGRDIVQEIEFANNSTLMWYAGYETFDITPSEVFTAAVFNWKQAVGSVTIAGIEQVMNSGKEAIHNLLEARIENLNKSAQNFMGSAIYGDGTANNGKAVGGLALLVPDINTNTVGGIPAATQSWWQNKVYSFAANSIGGTPTGTQLVHAMNVTSLAQKRGTDAPDTIVTDATYFNIYRESMQANQRFTNDDHAGAGFASLVYEANTPVIYDDQCPAAHMYLLNTDYLFMRYAPSRNWKPLDEVRPVNQDAIVIPLVWAGAMTTSNRALQGVITA